jgi:hypothetical protein
MPASTGLGAGGAGEADHLLEVGAHARHRQSAQRVVGAECDHDDRGLVALQVRGQPAEAAGGGLARDARVRDLPVELRGTLAQQVHPSLVGGEAVGGRKAVAEDQQRSRGARGRGECEQGECGEHAAEQWKKAR